MFVYILVIVITLNCLYGLFFWLRIHALSNGFEDIPKVCSVSVIICAKNESVQLALNLPYVLSQSYNTTGDRPNYEVIVVNDGSTDNTLDVLNNLQHKFPHIKVVNVSPDDSNGKKQALAMGLATASYDIILMTDADCKPASINWLALMIAPLMAGKQIVAGYGGYNKMPGLLNAFIRWETMHTYLQYSTYAVSGIPYMAVGRNMACHRTVMQKAISHPMWRQLPYGDDDLLVTIAGTASNITVVCNPEAFTYSDAKSTVTEWIHQKQRHLSTGKFYKTSSKIMLGTYALLHAGVWMSLFFCLFLVSMKTVIVLLIVRCILYWYLWEKVLNKLHEKIPLYLMPLFDLGWMIYNFAFLPYITWKNKKNWK